MNPRPVLIVTAGHIDHGKSALVKALTGTDPDRLAEEKERGMTIDLGFAFLTDQIAFVDVPGHERFIKNMVSGIAPMAVAMLVVAADDGVMPQTREHLAILQLLGLQQGLIVVNKVDLVTEDWLELVVADVHQLVHDTFLNDAPIFKTSTIDNTGLDELRQYILNLPTRLAEPEGASSDVFRMPIDRVFTVKGYGTVVTGSVISGSLRVGAEVELLPQGRRLTVRRVETHYRQEDQIFTGQRAAINLPGIERHELQRGDFLATPGIFSATRLLTVHLSILEEAAPVEYNDPLWVHLGTGVHLARVRWIGTNTVPGGAVGIAQLLFEQPVSAGFQERFIVRRYSPMQTIGGGVVLETNPRPLRKKDSDYSARLQALRGQPLERWLLFYLDEHRQDLVSLDTLSRQFSRSASEIEKTLQPLIQSKQILAVKEGHITKNSFEDLISRIENYLSAYHRRNPLVPAIAKSQILSDLNLSPALGNFLLSQMLQSGRLKQVNDGYALPAFYPEPSPEEQVLIQKIEAQLIAAGLNPPSIAELASQLNLAPEKLFTILNLLVYQGRVLLIAKTFPFHCEAVAKAKQKLLTFFQTHPTATVSELKDILNSSRKYTIPLLNYFDQVGLTIREGDLRRLREQTDG